MLFSSQIFILVFLPIVVVLYYKINKQILRIRLLIIASFIFYGYWDIRFLPLLFTSISLNWAIAYFYIRNNKKLLIYSGVILNLLLIGVFKYLNFFTGIISEITNSNINEFNIILPLGISFFTFQQISYLVDLKRSQAKQYSFDEYLLYISFFPQLIAGPIVRHNQIIYQFSISPIRSDMHENISRGIILFTLGLLKKVFLADEFASLADAGFDAASGTEGISSAFAWFSVMSYTLQIYFDFSAYSDMAIGLGSIFGFKLPINFNNPYSSRNIQEFWRRWHITLSSFLRDYLYFPLGGSRRGQARYIVAIFVTMTLCGLWHGAGWSFVTWGIIHGIALIIFHYWSMLNLRLPGIFSWALTFLFVICGWVLFRAEDISLAGSMLNSMFVLNDMPLPDKFNDDVNFVMLGLLISMLGPTSYNLAFHKAAPKMWIMCVTSLLLVSILLRIGPGRSLDFIYFQF